MYNQQSVENSYIYITSSGDDWTIPRYIYHPRFNKTLKSVIADEETIDAYNIEKMDYVSDTEKNEYAYLRAISDRTDLIAKISNGSQSSQVQGENITGNLNIWTIYDSMEYDNNSISPRYGLESIKSPYTYELIGGAEKVDLHMDYADSYFRVQADNLLKANFIPEKEVSVNSSGGSSEVAITLNDEYLSLPWYTISVASIDSKEITLKNTSNGIIVESDNLEKITIKGNNRIETKELTLSTDKDEILISEQEKELVALIDKDNDGTYETVIANSNDANLADLETEGFTLSPEFNPSVREYSSSVNNCVSKISLTPVLENGTKAVISVNGAEVTDFSGKITANLKRGTNNIIITVSNEDGSGATEYHITVNRSGLPTWATVSIITTMCLIALRIVLHYTLWWIPWL